MQDKSKCIHITYRKRLFVQEHKYVAKTKYTTLYKIMSIIRHGENFNPLYHEQIWKIFSYVGLVNSMEFYA